ncbi:MAG TPA: hypothetical protein VMI54_01575 [Polyangiaceae bacterium]|nr:hypothetical protein [Polyangiaceae bacterium]
MSRIVGFSALLGLLLGGCSLSAGLYQSDTAVNQCKNDDDCSGARCEDGLCVGSGGSLTSLLVTVTPPPTFAGIDNLTYYEDHSTAGNYLPPNGGSLNITLDDSVKVTGTVSIDLDATKCVPMWTGPSNTTVMTSMSGGIPADVAFTPSQHLIGMPGDSYASTTDGMEFQQTLPPGQYDVYITPHLKLAATMAGDLDCQVPPRLLLNQTVTSNLDYKLPAASRLEVDVTWPLSQPYTDDLAQADPFFADPLAGWTLDLVDSATGRVLSYEEPVDTLLKTQPANPDMSVTYAVTLVYAPVYTVVKNMLEPADIGNDVLRLTPPLYDPRTCPTQDCTDQPLFTAPVVLAQVDGALVTADGKSAPAELVQTGLLPAPVDVEFQTALASDGTPVPATVFLRATSIDGVSGLSTSFSRSVDVGSDGVGDVALLPGHYHVTAAAKSGCLVGSCLGTVEADWVVAQTPSPQAGKIVQFSPPNTYGGSALIPDGRPAVGASVNLVASSVIIDTNVLNVGDGAVPPVPRATAGLVEDKGAFSFEADDGTFDLRVQPDPSTGYGWYVHPRFVLPDEQDQLSELDLDFPISYKGTVSAVTAMGTVPVPRALIRAYAYVNADGTLAAKSDSAVAAVQVAETYTDDASGDQGAFSLLVPSALATP